MSLSAPGACLFVVAAEPSGDLLGQSLIKGLSSSFPELRYEGIGGPLMESQGGFSSIVPLSSLSCMGLFSVIKRAPVLIDALSKARKHIARIRPTALLTIDAPDFSLRISQSAQDIPRIHCVAPSVWAWRSGRARALAQKTDHLLTLFPFEQDYFRHMRSSWVGHPIIDQPLGNAQRFWSQHGEPRPLLCLLPGSRQSEVSRFLPILLESAQRLKQTRPSLKTVVVCPPYLRAMAMGLSGPDLVISDEQEKRDAFAATTVAIASSGTVTLELAQQGTSMVVGYQLSPLSAWIARRMVRISHVCLLNILSKDPFIPECLQENFTPDVLCHHASLLLDSEQRRQNQIFNSRKVLSSLHAAPSFGRKAAQCIEKEISRFAGHPQDG